MEKPWRVISNADGVDEEFASLPEAIKSAEEVLALWRDQAHDDGEWDEDVEGIEIHLVTHAARITMRDGDNEGDGVEYGMTEILGNEIDEEMLKLRAQLATVAAERDDAARDRNGYYQHMLDARERSDQWEQTATNLLDRAERAEKDRDDLKAENANLRAATRGRTMYHSDEGVNREMGLFRAQLAAEKQRAERLREALTAVIALDYRYSATNMFGYKATKIAEQALADDAKEGV